MSTTSRTNWTGATAGRALSLRGPEQDAQLRATLEAAGVSPALLGRADLTPVALVSPARIQALDAQWRPTGTSQPASSFSRFQRMLEETRGLLGP